MKRYGIYLLLAAIVIASSKVDAQSGIVNIESIPSGARVIIDGKTIGITPYKLQKPAGQYSVRLEKPYYIPQTLIVNVEEGGNSVITEELEPEKVHVTIYINVGEQRPAFFLDDSNKPLDYSYWRGSISPGRHVIIARTSSESVVRDVIIPIGKDTVIVFSQDEFKTETAIAPPAPTTASAHSHTVNNSLDSTRESPEEEKIHSLYGDWTGKTKNDLVKIKIIIDSNRMYIYGNGKKIYEEPIKIYVNARGNVVFQDDTIIRGFIYGYYTDYGRPYFSFRIYNNLEYNNSLKCFQIDCYVERGPSYGTPPVNQTETVYLRKTQKKKKKK